MSQTTNRVCSPGAEKWLGVEQKVLNDGHVILVDYMGTDEQTIGIARISQGKILPHTEEAQVRRLTNYLMKNRHTSPFEFVDITWKWRLPIFAARQAIRHRTASVNEKSARYAEMDAVCYEPDMERIQGQDTKNRQGSAGALPDEIRRIFLETIKEVNEKAKRSYLFAVGQTDGPDAVGGLGVAKELSRIVLPVGVYTDWVWKMDLHNTLHFLGLRLDPHAQYEVRVYAEAMAKVIRDAWPIIWEAFEEHVLYAKRFSRSELVEIQDIMQEVLNTGFVGIGALKAYKEVLSKFDPKAFQF
jgi:thymidylate synthase (FAD)